MLLSDRESALYPPSRSCTKQIRSDRGLLRIDRRLVLRSGIVRGKDGCVCREAVKYGRNHASSTVYKLWIFQSRIAQGTFTVASLSH